MSESVRPPVLLPGDTLSRWQVWRRWLLKTFPGRALVLGAVIKAITWPLGALVTLPGWLDAVDMVGSLALLFAIAYALTRLAVWAKRRLLWRVRRKLILSYVFVQHQLVSRAIARPQPDRSGALPGADHAARSAAQRHARRDR
jgi:hypothetical protein